MNAARLKKERKCATCGATLFCDAAKMQEHGADHRLQDRAARSGIILPDRGIVLMDAPPGFERKAV